MPIDRVFFEETKEQKLRRIADERCSHFIDDLAEFLGQPDFTEHAERILFDPWNRYAGKVPFGRVSVPGGELRTHLLGEDSP